MDMLKIAKAWGRNRRPRCAAVIVAAGSSSRMGGEDKLWADLGGKPLLLRTMQAFEQAPGIDEIVVVVRQERLLAVDALARANELDKVRSIVAGGEERIDSVLAGLEAVGSKMRLAAIHDGARPLVTPELIARTVRLAAKTGAAAPAVPVKDTVKLVERGVVASTPARESLRAVQTPQVFDADLLLGALFQAKQDEAAVTDDCTAVERIGMKVHLTEGDDENFKITTPIDLLAARAVWEARQA